LDRLGIAVRNNERAKWFVSNQTMILMTAFLLENGKHK
jgi:hypothetical protein